MNAVNLKRGFTVTELVIIIAVIAIIAAVAVPTLSDVIKKADDASALPKARTYYAEYLALYNYTEHQLVNVNYIIRVSEDQYVAVTGGTFLSTVYETEADAFAAIKSIDKSYTYDLIGNVTDTDDSSSEQ